MLLTQTTALALDAYRDINSKKLFWITLVLSCLVVLVFVFVGINERGVVIFGNELPGFWNTTIIPASTFYMFLFVSLAIPFWLTWIATTLALISVCGIFPDFLAGGSVDLYLSRPIGRLRLFITKYVLGLIFVAAQVLVFAIGAFVVIGLRGGQWEPKIFLAVPLVTLTFSYLFCVCVLAGVVTRSALASLLVTVVFWACLFALNSVDSILGFVHKATELRVENQQALIDQQGRIAAAASTTQATTRAASQIDSLEARLPEFERQADRWRFWYRTQYALRTILPKTNETTALLSRWVVDRRPIRQAEQKAEESRFLRIFGASPTAIRTDQDGNARWPDDDQPVMRERLDEMRQGRSTTWIVGTSVAFQAVVLSLAGFIFCRRDF